MLSNLYPPHVVGGYELYCEGVVDHLRSSGHSVTVLTSKGPVPEQQHVRRELNLYIRGAETRQPHPLRRLPRERQDHRALSRTPQWDVALVFHMVGLAKSLLTALHERGPVGYVVGDLWPAWDLLTDTWLGRLRPEGPPGTPPTGIPRLRYPSVLARAVAPLASEMGVPVRWPDLFRRGHWWANSRWTLDTLAETKGLPLADPRVIRHGIPLELFPPRSRGPGAQRLLYVGRITGQKGVEVALEAMGHLPGSTLSLVGHPDPDYVRALRLPPGVDLRPPVQRWRLAEIYSSHDVLLFPVTWNEPLGLVPLEAMAVGLPVVATGTGGSSEYLVHEQNCLLAAPGDPRALADAAKRLLSDESLRRRLTTSGRRTAEENSLEASARKIEAAAGGLVRQEDPQGQAAG
ncbi:MAG: glycosyltransferase family 4 protein [Candidatus Rokuibacteriota bacterium]